MLLAPDLLRLTPDDAAPRWPTAPCTRPDLYRRKDAARRDGGPSAVSGKPQAHVRYMIRTAPELTTHPGRYELKTHELIFEGRADGLRYSYRLSGELFDLPMLRDGQLVVLARVRNAHRAHVERALTKGESS